ncbi:putative GNAT family N-acyltransferase [Thermosporothrix hazakensis]|jgi:predicted GNAT family N-acyltransferase|uniref:Putative GNAT family N-acyltransferase n=2 Tax=Thermosporothrix TaxID=768650 RepID=A0A326UQV1_THEHA|nr:GNAT family N-acetyltransferase [Thermosporothrix hazakensis]PZW36409.1 putative GNAT family N-acyltransferase [Thermosporothrix hazakensis]BBH88876.1 putative N-acetyltransferase YitI [Thermosporothrix sp. COM3]GCE47061.1 putative N-acetyltransferase YitI [Thermosporothrix hazakensis]
MLQIRSISAEETYPLRQRVLRPHQALEACAYPHDTDETSFHAGCFFEDQLIGIGSIFREAQDGTTNRNIWRIRGMAVAPEQQGKGIGGRILTALIAYVTAQGQPGEIWCNGRITAKGFYERYGFQQLGEVFELPGIGPHVVMHRPIEV